MEVLDKMDNFKREGEKGKEKREKRSISKKVVQTVHFFT